MQRSLTWVAAILGLVAAGFLVACGTSYSPSNDGLLVVPSLGSAVVQAFSFRLNNGSVSTINTNPGITGQPTSIIVDPSGNYAYLGTIGGGINSYKINSDGTLASPVMVTAADIAGLAVDSAGKLLFAANGAGGGVSVFSIGSGGSLSAAGSATLPTTAGGSIPNASALAVSPTIFPAATATGTCTNNANPGENLYVADSANNMLYEYSVNASSGALTLVSTGNQQGVATGSAPVGTGTIPSGVAVDPCNRFVYVSNGIPSNTISAFSICSAVSPQCPNANGSLVTVAGSPFAASSVGPAALQVDALGNFLYVVNTASNNLSAFKISPVSGALTALTPATLATGTRPVAIAIRSDDSWLFVANFDAGTISQFAIAPATGALTPGTAIITDNQPTGVAVK